MSKNQDRLNAMTYNTEYTVGDATSFRERHYLRLIEVLTARVADASFRGENYTLSQEDCSELKGAIRTHNGQDTLDAIEKSVQSVKLPKMIQRYIDALVSEEDEDDVVSDFLRYRDENKFKSGWMINSEWISRREDMIRDHLPIGFVDMVSYISDDTEKAIDDEFNGVVYKTDFNNLSKALNEGFNPEMTHRTTSNGSAANIAKDSKVAIITDGGDGFSICVDENEEVDWIYNNYLEKL